MDAAETKAKKVWGRPREEWLALDNENHDQFAAAMMLCEDASGSCVRTGFCSNDGDCFLLGGEAARAAAKQIDKLAQGESGLVADALRDAARKLRIEADEARKRR